MRLVLLIILAVSLRTSSADSEIIFSSEADGGVIARASGIRLGIDRQMGLSVDLVDPQTGNVVALGVPPGPGFPVCAPVLLSGRRLAFRLIQEQRTVQALTSAHGRGQALVLRGRAEKPDLDLRLSIELYEKYPNSVFLQAVVISRDGRPVKIDRVALAPLRLVETAGTRPDSGLWAFQGGSYFWSQDFIAPLPPGTDQENYQGMNAPGVGGGVPLAVLWGRNGGLGLALLAQKPSPVALPVRVDTSGRAFVWLEQRSQAELAEGDSLRLPPVQVSAGRGDFFGPTRAFARAMADLGLKPPPYPKESYEVPWCTWGLRGGFTVEDILGRLDELKELGIRTITVDAGWYGRPDGGGELGDWEPSPQKFPNGEKSIRELTARLHDRGFAVRLWWSPFSADADSRLFRDHPDWFVRDRDGHPVHGAFDGWALCPAHPAVKPYLLEWTRRIIKDWGFDGLKIDGTGLNFTAPCHAPGHNHSDPWESSREFPELYRTIYETAMGIDSGTVIEVCPCGIVPNFYHLPYYNLPVTADPAPFFQPKGIWQARVRARFLKALFGPTAPVHMDYVEWGSQGPLTLKDFASQIGVGGVAATMYAQFGAGYQVRPFGGEAFPLPAAQTCALLPESAREYYRQWIALYHRLRLYDGEYLDLYDIAFDYPETHAVARGDTLHYGFYTSYRPGENHYSGPITLRGLKAGEDYRIVDSVRNMELARGAGPEIKLTVQFADHLLLTAEPRR